MGILVYNKFMTVHLHTRSCYTLLESTLRTEQIAARAAEFGYTSACLTDRGVLYGVPSFVAACRKHGVHPVIGMEVICAYRDAQVPFLLLARDNQGYQNLIRLSSLICSRKEAVTYEELIRFCSECGSRLKD